MIRAEVQSVPLGISPTIRVRVAKEHGTLEREPDPLLVDLRLKNSLTITCFVVLHLIITDSHSGWMAAARFGNDVLPPKNGERYLESVPVFWSASNASLNSALFSETRPLSLS